MGVRREGDFLRIPKRFKLLGHTIEVVERPELIHERNWNGASDYQKCQIEMVPKSPSNPVSDSKYESVFFHEFAHFLLYYGGAGINGMLDGKDAHQVEDFVELIGGLLHQALATMEYDDMDSGAVRDVTRQHSTQQGGAS